MKAHGRRIGIAPLVLIAADISVIFFTLPSHTVDTNCAASRQMLWLSQTNQTIWFAVKVHTVFKRDFRQGCTVRETEQNSQVKWTDNGLYHSGLFSNRGATDFLFCTWSAPDHSALRFSGCCKLFFSAVPVQLKNTEPIYYGTTHHEGPQVCY